MIKLIFDIKKNSIAWLVIFFEIEGNERALVKIPVGDPGVIRDIDTPGDLWPPLRI